MFSCCRAKTKDSSKVSNKKDKSKNKTDESGDGGVGPRTATAGDNKLIIPTITIENGKASDSSFANDSCNVDVATTESGNGSGSGSDAALAVGNGSEEYNEDDDSALRSAETNLCNDDNDDDDQMPATDAVATEAKQDAETIVTNGLRNGDYDDDHDKQRQSTPPPASTATPTAKIPSCHDDVNNSHNTINQSNVLPTTTTTTTITTIMEAETIPSTTVEQHGYHSPYHRYSNDDAPPTKSCLSRHNSTHTSIKKKVNISIEPEIIEPDPLPPPPYDHDDDDVFSDSLPPPKRESMCAPYIERDDELVSFAHGLPEWFNNERINDIGCIEPPVTPVGRDELELKRQRLYSDLLRAAQAAVEHSVRFTPFGGEISAYSVDVRGDCDPDLKPSVAENLEHLVNRLEQLVERLERSISARELEIANRTFDTVLERKRESFDIESTELPPLPVEAISSAAETLDQRIERIESTLNKINDRHSSSLSASTSQSSQQQQLQKEGSLENIPTVLEDYQALSADEVVSEEEEALLPPPPNMSVLGYQDIISGPLSQYLALSVKIGGDVAKHAELVKKAFDAQLQYVTMATQCSQPSQDKQMELLQPTSTQISAIQDYREKSRTSPYFNHLSAISESIPALGWVCVAPTPGPHVKEMNDAGQFYTNRVLKEWKEKDAKHVEWARAWIQTLAELQAYIKQYHTTGLVWSGKGGVPAGRAAPPPPPIGACPPPPPPPAFDLAAMSLDGGADERSALFAEINQGEAITKNLKRVTADMQTHKNPTLRTGPAPFKATQFGSVGPAAPVVPVAKAPVFMRDGKKWIIEHQKNNAGLLVDNAEMNNVVYMFKCEGSTLTVKGKVNNIVLDSCKKCSLLFDSVVASIEFVNCQSVQMQVLGFVPTVSIDKTDGCQMYLSKESLGVEVVSSKSSEMNIMLPEANGDYTELAVPEQYKTTISGKTLKTICVDSLG